MVGGGGWRTVQGPDWQRTPGRNGWRKIAAMEDQLRLERGRSDAEKLIAFLRSRIDSRSRTGIRMCPLQDFAGPGLPPEGIQTIRRIVSLQSSWLRVSLQDMCSQALLGLPYVERRRRNETEAAGGPERIAEA